ncbi:Uncharacterized protein FWK35_00032090 [Aphis craccivora]|uniref:Uncharacterized protein n=1 Tax=Aphis craccivora TaxID=307492 RepID=A0A6G0VPM7_APHCR|nr:Uncharacterized protein FWK35_00032090 [Aphis craccivora]
MTTRPRLALPEPLRLVTSSSDLIHSPKVYLNYFWLLHCFKKKKYLHKFPKLDSNTSKSSYDKSPHERDYSMSSWINHLSYGGIIVARLNVYLKNNTKQIPKGVGVVKNLTKKIVSGMDVEKKYQKYLSVIYYNILKYFIIDTK